MKILIPASEGKAKVIATSDLKFEDSNFQFNESVLQVVNLLELIDEEGLDNRWKRHKEMADFTDFYNFVCADFKNQKIIRYD